MARRRRQPRPYRRVGHGLQEAAKGKGRHAVERRDFGAATMPAPHGGTLEGFLAALPAGSERRCGCPFHESDSGRSAVAIHTLDGGRLLFCHVEGTTYVHHSASARPPTVDQLDAVDLAPTVETTAARLLRDGRFGDVVSLVVQQADPSDALLSINQEAMAGEQGVAAERERDDALGVYEGRLTKKREAADAIDPGVVAGAKRALGTAAHLVRTVQAKMRREGLPLPDPKKPCGVHLGLHNARDGRFSARRQVCTSLSCPTCGPVVVSRKLAAVLKCPVVNAKGRGVGASLGDRTLWWFAVEEARFEGFTRAWRDAYPRLPRIDLYGDHLPKRKSGISPAPRRRGTPTWRSPSRTGGWSTFDPTVGRKRKRANAAIPDALDVLRDASERWAMVVRLGLATFRVEAGDVDGVDLAPSVHGRISSSYGLSLDPAGLVRTASVSAWVGLGPVKASAVKASMEARRIAHTVEERDASGGKVVESASSLGFVAPSVASEILDEAGTRKPKPVPAPVTFAAEPDVDVADLLDTFDEPVRVDHEEATSAVVPG